MKLNDDNTKCMCNNDSVLLLGMVACSRNVKMSQQWVTKEWGYLFSDHFRGAPFPTSSMVNRGPGFTNWTAGVKSSSVSGVPSGNRLEAVDFLFGLFATDTGAVQLSRGPSKVCHFSS